MSRDEHNTRRILLDLGIGDFNATMILPCMFMGPAQTDPSMAQVQLLTTALQKNMIKMGASWLKITGRIDEQTAHCLHALVGPYWNQTTWGELASAVVTARGNKKKLKRPSPSGKVTLGALGFDLPSPPAIPGGIITYGIAGYFLVRHFMKGR